MTWKDGEEVECLLNALKAYFQSSSPPKTEEQKLRQMAQLRQQAGASGSALPESLLRAAIGTGMVESLPLLPQLRERAFEAVTMYVDDEGQLKDLPLNPRASDVASRCRGAPVSVRGDAFVGRVRDDGDDVFERLSFTADELSSSADWFAAAEAAARRAAARAGSMAEERQGLKDRLERSAREREAAAAAPSIVEITPEAHAEACAHKDRGNALFKAGDWRAAIDAYSAAVDRDPTLVAAFNNRAQAHLNAGQPAMAEVDASRVLELAPKDPKALLRRAVARQALGKEEQAIRDYRALLRVQPGNKQGRDKLEHLLKKTKDATEQEQTVEGEKGEKAEDAGANPTAE